MTPSDSPEPKFRRRAEARPDDILDAALLLFTEQGFSRTTVEQIAKRAGLSKGAVYLYFPSKSAILEGLVARMVAPITASIFDAIKGYEGDPRPLLVQFVRMMGQALSDAKQRAVPLIVLHEAPGAPEIAAMFRNELLDHAIPAITALLAQGVAGGHIRAVDPELTARSVLGPLFAHILLYEIFGITPEGGLQMERLVENHITILCAGLAPEEGEAS